MGFYTLQKARRKFEGSIRKSHGRGGIPFGVQSFNDFELVEDSESLAGIARQEIFEEVKGVNKNGKENEKDDQWLPERVIEVKSKADRYLVLRHKETRRVRIKRDDSLDRMPLLPRSESRVFDAFRFMSYSVWAAADSHSVTAERQAQRKLRTMISRDQWRQYTLTGTFFEWSKRSKKKYWFRRCMPVVVSATHVADDDQIYARPIVALCLHPHGYYSGTTIGALCPTDNIIAELLLMRTDEPTLWKKATQHELSEPNARL